MKRVLVLLLSILLLAGTTGCRYSAQATDTTETTTTTVQIDGIAQTTGVTMVCITETGECYYRYSCFCLWNSSHTITLTAAIRKGYRACQHCEPPVE